MSTTTVYEHILDELAQGEMKELERKVFQSLRRVYPSSRSRTGLLFDCFGYEPEPRENLNNNSDDRKIRIAIASLFDKGIPIVSTSGAAGYRLDIDAESWADVVYELESRAISLQARLHTAKVIQAKIRRIGLEAIPPAVPTKPQQLSLLEVE